MAHVIFGGALLLMFYWSRRLPGKEARPWFYLRLTFFFFFLWNIDALAVHLLELYLSTNTYYSASFQSTISGPLNWKYLLYYFLRFDHLFCVPAMYFLWKSLQSFVQEEYAEF
ncbi:hypothetical protein [Thermosulfurimonas marina]|nr:hypothetical protein [Thermosulfurimonas marina]